MNLCDGSDAEHRHPPIVYDERPDHCPMCELMDKVESAQTEVNDAASDIQSRKDELSKMLETELARVYEATKSSEVAELYIKLTPVVTLDTLRKVVDTLSEAHADLDSINIDD